jgi:antitoxin ParD1/3/4
MPQDSKFSVALTPELAAAVNHAVESGEYGSSNEVIREALSDWVARRRLLQHERERLQELWAEGLHGGSGKFENMTAIKTEARRRLTDSEFRAKD